MSSTQQPLIIKDWDQGIGASPHKGFGLFRNADIESFPGAVKVNKKPGSYFHSIPTQTFTANATSNECTAPTAVETNGINFNGAAVYFTTTGTLPAGLSTNTIYYLYKISSAVFKVCTSYQNSAGSSAGTVIDITDAGSGVHTINQVAIGTINWVIKDPRTGIHWMLGSNGRVWFAISNIAYLLHNSALETAATGITNASGNGICLNPFSSTSLTYLFVFRNAKIDVINVFGLTAIEALGWSNNWQSLNSGTASTNTHHALKGQDDAVYFCDDRYVGSIIENAGSTFDPSSSGTYTYNNQALDLPVYEVAQCLEELGSDLLIGGNTLNQIYPWDRISDSFNIPLSVPEFSVKKMKNIGGTVYILAGSTGNIYLTQGTYTKWFVRLPVYLTNNAGSIQSNYVTWGGIAAVGASLLVGAGTVTSGNSGVWRIFPNGRMIIDNVPSAGSTNVTAIYAETEFYIMGYSGGADNFNSAQYGTLLYDSFQTVIQSALFRVATKLGKATYSRLEVVLDRPATGGNIRVSYRFDLSSNFSTIDTFSADGTTYIFTSETVGLIDIDDIQVQVEMNDSNFGAVDIGLAEIRLFP